MKRRPTSRDEGRAEVLARAATAIAEHGFHGMSMRALAEATGRSLAGFYHLFDSKEDILFALQRGAFEQLIAGIEQALASVSSPTERLRSFVSHHTHFAVEQPDVMRVLVHEAAALPPTQRSVIRDLKHRYFLLGRAVLADVMLEGRSGQLDPAEVDRVTYCTFGMLNWIYGWYDAAKHGTADDVSDTIAGLVLAGAGRAQAAQGGALPNVRSSSTSPVGRSPTHRSGASSSRSPAPQQPPQSQRGRR